LKQENNSLLEEVKTALRDNLSKGATDVDKLTKEEHEASKRAIDHNFQKHFNRIKIWQYWVFRFGIPVLFASVFVIVFIIAVVALLYVHISNVLESPEKTYKLLSNLLEYVLVAFSALFSANCIKKFSNKK